MKNLLYTSKKAIPFKEIIYLESDSNYTQIFLRNSGKKITASKSLVHIHALLCDQEFIRINRSQAVNKNFIESFKKIPNCVLLKLKDGKVLKTSRRRTQDFLKAL
ncbi:LytR/AlgR family response regulator transcription factor [Jiulongibacter sp. NS-SX5]|uniref:LytR/AlgR family response regulator transcription factor n=1 Tax=Jiulongibacter sp. NS-SX5 TaxID=3463854 RepID=UPI004059396B